MLIFDLEDGNHIDVPLEGKIMLGSTEGCDVLVDAEGIAGHHAEIYPAPEGGYWVRDLGSAEGTLINGKRVSFQQLVAGDRLNFGPLSGRFVSAPGQNDKPAESEVARHAPAVNESPGADLPAEDAALEKLRQLEAEEAALKAQRESEERQHQEKLLSVQAEVGQHESHLAARRKETAELAAQLEEKKQEQTRLDAALEKLRQHEAEETALKAQRESEERQHQEKLATLQKEAGEQEARIKSVEAAIAEKKKEHEQSEAALQAAQESARQHLAKEQAEEQHIQERIAAFKLELAQQEAKLAERREEETALNARIEQKRHEHTSTETALLAVRDSLQGQKARLPEIEKAEQERYEQLSKAHGEAVGKHGVLIKTLEALSGQERQRLVDLERLQQDADALEARRDAARVELQNQEAALIDARSSLKEAEEKRSGLDKSNQELESRHHDLVTQAAKLSESLSEHSARETRLRSTLEELEKARATAEAGLKDREIKLQEQHATLASTAEALKQKEEKHSGLQGVHQELSVRHKDLSSQVAKLLEVVSGHKSEEQRLRNLVAVQTGAQTRVESTLREKEKSLREREAALAKTEEKNAGLQSAHQELQSKQKELTSQVAKITETINGHRTEEQRLRASLQELGKARTTAEGGLKDCEGKLKGKNTALAAATEALKKVEAEPSSHLAAQQKQTAEHQELNARIAQHSATVSTLKSDEQRLGKLVEELTSSHTKAGTALLEKEKQLREREATLAKVAAELKQTEEKHKSLQAAHHSLQSKHHDLGAEIAKATTAFTSHKSEEDRLRAIVQDLEKARAAAEVTLKERETKLLEQNAALTAAAETLKRTEESRAASQKELETFKTEHQKLVIDARRLEAANAGRKAEEDRLRQEMKTVEARHAAADASMRERAALLNERETAVSKATEALHDAREQHSMLIAEIEQFQGQVTRLTTEQQNLSQMRGRLTAENASLASLEKSLRQSITELETKKDEARIGHDEQKAKLNSITVSHADARSSYGELVKDLESLRTERTGLQTDMAALQNRSMALRSEVEAARFESDRLGNLTKNSRKEIELLGNTKAELLTQKKNLETQVTQTDERLETLQGAETHLLKAQAEYHKTQEAQASMIAAMSAITAQRDATSAHVTELERQIGDMRQLRAQLERGVTDYQNRHREMKREFEEYQSSTDSTRRALEENLRQLEKKSEDLHARHEAVSRKFTEVQIRHAELSEQNHNFEAALRRLDEVAENIRKSEWTIKELEGRRKSLDQSCADTQLQLKKLAEGQTALTVSLEQLEARKSAVQKELKSLTENEKRERARYEELRTLNTDVEQVAAGQRKKYEEAIETMRHEAALLEARLTRARTWNDDLDKLYAKLATMPEGSPEANQFWQEIQRHKQVIEEQLPAGVQIRPGGRGQIVPRGRR